MLELIRKVCAAHGVAGFEKKAAETICNEIKNYTDEQRTDALGNLIAIKRGNGKGRKIMLCAHMDEIGFMATFIEEKGQIRISPVGGVGLSAISYSLVLSENGIRGVIVPNAGTKPADYTPDKFYIDIGAKTKKEAEKKVKIGDVFRFDAGITCLMNGRICGHPLDDRIGCVVLLEVAKKLSEVQLDDDIYYVFSVQEEVGCRGSKPASFSIAPDIALAFDVTGVGDVPGATPMACAVGDGAAVKIKDSSVICDPMLVDALVETAKANKIKYQLEVLTYGGTDTSAMQMSGVGSRAAAISIPTRYIHSANEMLDIKDVEACINLTVAYIKGLGK